MTNKKLEAKRLIIFLLLAFAIAWVPAIVLNNVFGYSKWFETNKMLLLAQPVLYAPAIANIITRKLTHECWHDSMLHLRLKGNMKYYIVALLIVSAMSAADGIFTTIIYGNNDWSDLGRYFTGEQAVSTLLETLATVPLYAFITFGEEFGWRGYMNQKMEPLIGTTGTVILGGIIWGLWHTPLTIEGHSFGMDYNGYPYLGIAAMCVICTFHGMLLMWLTKKTGSVYPAAIVHAMIDFGGRITNQLLISGVPVDFSPTIPRQLIMMIPTFVICFVFLIFMLRNSKNEKKTK